MDLQDIEQLYRALVESVDDVVFVIGQDMRYRMFNERGLKRLGLTKKDVIGRTPSESFGKQMGARFEQHNRQVMTTKKPLVIEEWLVIGNRHVCFSTVLTPIVARSGEVTAIAGIGRDISELKRMTEELATYTKEMEAIVNQRVRYERLIAELTQEANKRQPLKSFLSTVMLRLGEALGVSRTYMFEFDPLQKEVHCVQEWVSTGIEPSPEEFLHIKIDDQPWAASELLSDRVVCIEDTQTVKAPEFREMLKAQKIKSILIAPIISFAKPFGFIGVEECLLHRRWEDMDVDLLRTVGSIITQTVERRRLEEEILKTERLAATGRLAAGLAHEINNPLQGITLHLDALRDHIDKSKERNFNFVLEGFARISKIIARLLNIHKFVRKTEIVDVNSLFEEGVQPVANQLKVRGIKVRWELAKDLPRISCDKSQIHQVILNVLLNSLDSMDGGGSLALSTFPCEEGIAIEIKDTGSGITEENIPYLFEPFFSTKGKAGTGLGLFVSHAIVTEHGGRISVKSRVGKGTTVRIILPRDAGGAKQKTEV